MSDHNEANNLPSTGKSSFNRAMYLTLRFVSIFFGIVSIGCIAGSIPYAPFFGDSWTGYDTTTVFFDTTPPYNYLCIAAASMCVFWSLVSTLVFLGRSNEQYPYSPGLDIVIDFVVGIMAVVSGSGLAQWLHLNEHYKWSACLKDVYEPDFGYTFPDGCSEADAEKLGRLQIVGTVFLFFAFACHFWIWCLACGVRLSTSDGGTNTGSDPRKESTLEDLPAQKDGNPPAYRQGNGNLPAYSS